MTNSADISASVRDVTVCSTATVPDVLRSRGGVLTGQDVAAIIEALEADYADLTEDFELIVADEDMTQIGHRSEGPAKLTGRTSGRHRAQRRRGTFVGFFTGEPQPSAATR